MYLYYTKTDRYYIIMAGQADIATAKETKGKEAAPGTGSHGEEEKSDNSKNVASMLLLYKFVISISIVL